MRTLKIEEFVCNPLPEIRIQKQKNNMSMSTRSAWMMKQSGNINDLNLIEQPFDETLQPGEVLVQVKAVGLNFADVFMCHGLYDAAPKTNLVPGYEFSGIITAKGVNPNPNDNPNNKFNDFAVGDRIIGVSRFNSYVSKIIVSHDYIRHVPASWSFEQGAAIAVQGLTALYGLQTLGNLRKNPKPSTTVLVHSIAGGVGLLCISLLRRRGVKFIGTVGSQSKKDFLVKEKHMPEECVIVRTSGREFSGQLAKALKYLEEDGLDIIFDSLLGDFFQPAMAVLRPQGRCIVVGAGSLTTSSSSPNWLQLGWRFFWRPKIDPLELNARNHSVMGFNLVWLFDQIEELGELWDQLMEAQVEAPLVGHTFGFEEARDALRLLQSGKTKGKVVLSLCLDQ